MIFDTIIDNSFNYVSEFTNIYIRHLIKQSLIKYLEDPNDIVIKSKNIKETIYFYINKVKFNNNIIDGISTPIKIDSFIAEDIIIKIKWKEEYETSIKLNTIKIFYNLTDISNDRISDNILYSLYESVFNSITVNLKNSMENSFNYSLFSIDKGHKADNILLDFEEDINYLVNCSKIKIKNFEIIDLTSNIKFTIKSIIHKRIKLKNREYISILFLNQLNLIEYTTLLNILKIPISHIFIKDNYDYMIKIKDINFNLSEKNNFFWFIKILKNYFLISESKGESEDLCKKIDIDKIKITYYLKNNKFELKLNNIRYNNYYFFIRKAILLNSIYKSNIFKNELIMFSKKIGVKMSAEGYNCTIKTILLNFYNTGFNRYKIIIDDLFNINKLFDIKNDKINNEEELSFSNFNDNEIIKNSRFKCKYIKISIIDGNYKEADRMIFNFLNSEYNYHVFSNRLIKNNFKIENFEVIDGIQDSVWNKFLYKDSKIDLLKIKWIKSKDIKNTVLFLKISLSPIILNIDEHCIIYLLTIIDNFKKIFDIEGDKEENNIIIKESIINELMFTISYKPISKDIIGFSNKYSNFFKVAKIRDINFYLDRIYLDDIYTIDKLKEKIYQIWLNDLKKNQFHKFILLVDIFKYFFYILSDIITNIESLRDDKNTSMFLKIKKSISGIGISFISNFLDMTSRGCIGTFNLLENFNNNLNIKETSKYQDLPKNFNDSIEKSKNDIVNRYNIILNQNYNISYRIIQPFLGITESIFNTLVGFHHSIKPNDYLRKRDRYDKSI